MALYNMVGCNTNRTHSGGVKLRAGQFQGYKPRVNIGNTTEVNETIIFNTKKSNNSCCCSYTPQGACMGGGGGGLFGLVMALPQVVSMLQMIFGGKKETPEPEGGGSPEEKVTPETKPPEQPKQAKETVHDENVEPDPPQDLYAATITPETVKQEDITHTVKHGECWYDVLDAKYPGIPNKDRKAAMRALKQANGMTNMNSADMPRKMILPPEIKVGDNVYKLDNNGKVKGSVTKFTQGGMYNANISSRESTTYSVTGTKNGESAYSEKFNARADAEAAKTKWESQNKDK